MVGMYIGMYIHPRSNSRWFCCSQPWIDESRRRTSPAASSTMATAKAPGPKASVAPSRCFRKLTGLRLPCCRLRLRRSCISEMAMSACITNASASTRLETASVNIHVIDSGIDSSDEGTPGSMGVAQQLVVLTAN